jgi:hypothetical protein
MGYKAEFNIKIYSSQNEGVTLSYDLDEIIITDLQGPYTYDLNQAGAYPRGTGITRDEQTGKYFLDIPARVEFHLMIDVTSQREGQATAETDVIIATRNTFQEEKEIFSKNENLSQSISNTRSNWGNIIG